MSLGRSPIRQFAPVPTGMLSAQIYRWARNMTNWLGTFTVSTWAYPTGSTFLSSQPYTPVVGTTGSTYVSTHFVHPLASTLASRRWFRTWLASTKAGPPMSLAGISVSTTAGSLLDVANSQFYLYTGANYSANWSFKNLPTSCFAAVQMADGLPVWSAKLKTSVVTNTAWYIYYSVHAESGDWRKVYLEPRYSADASRYPNDVNLGLWTCLTPWGTVSPSLTSVLFSTGIVVLKTVTVGRYYNIRLKGSTSPNWMRIKKTGAGQTALHTWALPYGRAWLQSTFTWVA